MSVRLLHSQILPLSDPRFRFTARLRPQISCISSDKSNNNDGERRRPIRSPRRKRPARRATVMSDAQLALELAAEAEKMKVRAEERESAMRRSAEMLFDELCAYLKMREEREEVKRRWRRMAEDERRGLVAAFVSDWGADFQPLSRRGVQQLVDEFVGVDGGEGVSNLESVAAFGISGLKKLIGFVSG